MNNLEKWPTSAAPVRWCMAALAICLLILGPSALADESTQNRTTDSTVQTDPAPTDAESIHHETPDDPPYPASSTDPPQARTRSGPVQRGMFTSFQVNVDQNGDNILGDAANEPSIAVDPTHPDRMAIGWRQFDTVLSNFRQAGWAYTVDPTDSWTFPSVLEPGFFRSDPVLDADAEGNFYYYSLRFNFTCQLFKSGNGGMSWDTGVEAFGGDKAWIAIDRTGGEGHGHLYAAWSFFFGCCSSRTFTRSTDGGLTFDRPIAVPRSPLFGTLAVGPDGELYIAGVLPGDFSIFTVIRSSSAKFADQSPSFELTSLVDMGGTLGFRQAVNPVGLLGQVWVAVDHSNTNSRGNVYLLSSVNPTNSDPADVMFARSQDGGNTWTSPARINDDPLSVKAWQWFGTMSVAPDGRIDAIWNDTRSDPSATFSEVHYTYSFDQGDTWSKNVPVTPPFNHFLGYPRQNKLGDYYDMVSDLGGAHLAYAATFNGEQDVYYIRLGDCNANGIHDGRELEAGMGLDANSNGFLDECERTLFVDADAVGNNDGSSWENAFTSLSDALEIADGPDQIWVARGIYTPAPPNGNRQAAFDVREGVSVFGGFEGADSQSYPGGESLLAQRDWGSNPAVLSGDLNGNDTTAGRSDNAYHVVRPVPSAGERAYLDGFIITAGQADGPELEDGIGGGVYASQRHIALHNCTIRDNFASFAGGGAAQWREGSLSLTNCLVSGNRSTLAAGLLAFVGQVTVINSTIVGNVADSLSGGLYHETGLLTVTNSLLWHNTSAGQADESGQILSLFDDAIVNHSCIQGWTGALGGNGNTSADPLLIDADGPDDTFGTEDDNPHLSAGSPCIDAADNTALPADVKDLDGDGDTDELIPFDLDNNPRFMDEPSTPDTGNPDGLNPVVDMGAYEFQPLMLDLDVDIKPGACPNSFNRNSHGVLTVALLGANALDVTQVDSDSVTLSRTDGLGGSVAPHQGPPGPRSQFEDLGTPFEGQSCDCHDATTDGVMDLSIKFITDELVAALDLNGLAPGDLIELTLSGVMLDGTPFSGSDCIRLVPPGTPPGLLTVDSGEATRWIDVAPLDLQLDGGGFGLFDRTYPLTSAITLTAPATTVDGQSFLYWRVDGLRQATGVRTLDLIIVEEPSNARAVYGIPPTTEPPPKMQRFSDRL